MVLNDPAFLQQLEQWDARVLLDQKLGEYTSLGVGGVADVIVLRRTDALEPIVEGLRAREIPWRLLGGGTNVLPADGAHRAVCLRLASNSSPWVFEGDQVRVAAAAELGRTVMECAKRNFGGME